MGLRLSSVSVYGAPENSPLLRFRRQKRAADFRGRRRGPSALCRAGSRPKPAFFRAKEKEDLRVKSEVLFSEELPAISNVRSLVRSVLHYELLQIRDILFDLIIEESKVLGV